VDDSILGNTIIMGLQKRIEPIFGFSATHTLYYNNKILPYSVSSSEFNMYDNSGTVTTVFIKDVPNDAEPNMTGQGKLIAIDKNNNIISDIGTISYGTGEITLRNLVVQGYPSIMQYDIRINCKPQDQIDVISNVVIGVIPDYASIPVPMRNQILMLDDSVAMADHNIRSGLNVHAVPV
jgi:hypothetical protein